MPTSCAPTTSGAASGRPAFLLLGVRGLFLKVIAWRLKKRGSRMKMFAAIGDQPSLDFQQRDIGLTANESKKIVAVRWIPVRPLIPARRRR